MDALKDRVGGFTECTFMMACPVLLAVATKKVNMSSEGNTAVRHGVPAVAAISLLLCPLAFIPLGYVSARNAADVSELLKLWILRWTTGLVHLSAIGQMVLAYMVLLLILTVKSKTLLYLLLLVPLCLSVFALGIWSVARRDVDNMEEDEADNNDDDDDNEDKRLFNKKLELSLDLSAAVTYLLFLGLEGLALEGQTKVGKDLATSLGKPIAVTFVCCVLASVLMLLVTVPPIDYKDVERHDGLVLAHMTIHIMWAVLALCITAVVIMILSFQLNTIAGFTMTLVPCGVLFLSYVLCLCVPGLRGWEEYCRDDQLKPPPSLEMTKVTFTAFLAISLPSFRDGRLSGYTLAFIVTAAMSVIFGLGWRLLTQFNQKAAVWTSKVACLCTHAWLAAAAIELMCMAKQALSPG